MLAMLKILKLNTHPNALSAAVTWQTPSVCVWIATPPATGQNFPVH